MKIVVIKYNDPYKDYLRLCELFYINLLYLTQKRHSKIAMSIRCLKLKQFQNYN